MSASTAVLKAEARLIGRNRAGVFWVVAFPPLLLTILGLLPSFRAADPGARRAARQGRTRCGLRRDRVRARCRHRRLGLVRHESASRL
ncbi:hypothetical protein [Acrocarpospora sp. B8E8]|uniref:hypothetical protein n=1 Tax=Acrocarpospora sp. B8E8 TaxID=3153572 RepID=UPI00325F22BE